MTCFSLITFLTWNVSKKIQSFSLIKMSYSLNIAYLYAFKINSFFTLEKYIFLLFLTDC